MPHPISDLSYDEHDRRHHDVLDTHTLVVRQRIALPMDTQTRRVDASYIRRSDQKRSLSLPTTTLAVKLLILLVFVLNAKSWPFVWHGKYLVASRPSRPTRLIDDRPRTSSHHTVKVWYPAIMAHYRARRLGLQQYYRRLQIGLPKPTSDLASLPPQIRRAIELGRKHKFEHPLGVKSVKRYTAGFDDCE